MESTATESAVSTPSTGNMTTSSPAASGWLRGIVKNVPSGDRLIIMGVTRGGQIPPEKEILLAYVTAPRLGRKDSKEEAYAWDSREWLRKKCIGQNIVFKIEYKVDNINREFGTIYVGSDNVSISMAKLGLLKVREGGAGGNKTPNPLLVELQNAEKEAKVASVGIWSSSANANGLRQITPTGSPEAFLSKYKGQALAALVEAVISGNALRVTILPSFEQITVFLAGIQCPSLGKKMNASNVAKAEDNDDGLTSSNGSAGSTAEPFAREARYFTELKTLGREVRVVFNGQDKYGNLFGSVKYREGTSTLDLAESLCGVGVAKVAEWSSSMVPGGVARIRASERAAKESKLRMWHGYTPSNTGSTAIEDDKFKGIVTEIISGDTIVVRDSRTNEDRRVILSSVRAPRPGRSASDGKAEPWGADAKEFIRGRVIGKDVFVSMDYSRKVSSAKANGDDKSAPEKQNDRVMSFGTVTVHEKSEAKNLAELVVARGFATVVKHRSDDERSPHYDDLVAAEGRAQKNKKGIHSNKEAVTPHIVDLSRGNKDGGSNTSKRAKELLPFLQQKNTQTAVVDYVLSGHRLKLLLPKENSFVAFSLSGVRCPGQGEHLSEESLSFTRLCCMQRDVEVEFEAVDKNGGFLGHVRVGRLNLAQELLANGLAKLHGGFSEHQSLSLAENQAKAARKGLWENYDESEERRKKEAQQEADDSMQSKVYEMKGILSHINDATDFFFQQVDQSGADSIEEAMRSLSVKEKGVPLAEPTVGKICAAKFSCDNNWYRARINKVLDEGSAIDVTFIDYGNGEVLKVDKLQQLASGLDGYAPQASSCTLAFITVPSIEDEYGYEAASLFSELCSGVELRAKVEFTEKVDYSSKSKGKSSRKDGGKSKLHVTLFLPSGTNVNEQLVKEGYARVEKRRTARNYDAIETMTPMQEQAKTMRMGMWEYGDIDDDDDRDFTPRRR